MNLHNIKIAIEMASKDGNVRWHPVLPALRFEQAGIVIDVKSSDLANMAKVFSSGLSGPRLPVTLGHPDLDSSESQGWIIDLEVRDHEGNPTLFAAVDWLDEMAGKIDNKKFAYLSPVFSQGWTDEKGDEQGAALFAIGVTNSPHWKTQPELWNQFTAMNLGSMAGQQAETIDNKESKKMELEKQLEAAKAEIVELTAKHEESVKTNEGLTNTNKELTASNDKLKNSGDSKTVEFQAVIDEHKGTVKALKDEVVALQTKDRKREGESLISHFTSDEGGHRLLDHHIKDKEGKETELAKMAFDEPEKFKAIVNCFTANNIKQGAQGSAGSDELTFDEKQRKIAGEIHDEAKKANRSISFADCLAEARIQLSKEA